MSLTPRSDGDKISEDGTDQRRRKADIVKEEYERRSVENMIRNAAYKDSVGMDLLPEERFVLENKRWLLRKKRQIAEEKKK